MSRRINRAVRTEVLTSGGSVGTSAEGYYTYSHLDGQNGGHVLTVGLLNTAGAYTGADIKIYAFSPDFVGSILLATVPTAGFVGKLCTFNLTGIYYIDVQNGTDQNLLVQISS